MTNAGLPLIGLGPRVRQSPFFAATRRYGCKAYSVYNHMFMPLYYEDPVADYWRLINDVTLWDVACERQVEITGPDAARFTQYLTPRNLSQCQVGQCKYILITDDNGGVLNDPVLLKLGENHFWLSLADRDILLWAKGVAQNAGMDVTIREPDVSPVQVQGPKSPLLMTDLFGDWIMDLKYFWFRETKLDGIPLVVSRTGWSNERGYEIFLRDGQYGDKLWEMIMMVGQKYNIGLGAPSAIRRIEAGLLSYGLDMTEANNPFELGMDRLIDLEQEADFVGKEALKQIKAAGVQQKMVGLEIEAEPLPDNQTFWLVQHQGQSVGEVRSAVYSPRLEKNIAMAMLASEATDLGTAVTVETPNGQAAATVVKMPFYDPKKKIVTSTFSTEEVARQTKSPEPELSGVFRLGEVKK